MSFGYLEKSKKAFRGLKTVIYLPRWFEFQEKKQELSFDNREKNGIISIQYAEFSHLYETKKFLGDNKTVDEWKRGFVYDTSYEISLDNSCKKIYCSTLKSEHKYYFIN